MQTLKKFDSRWIFVLAAVGAAAGLGNLWRFPYLAYENGGGAFFVAYLVCLIVMGAALLILESGLGQLTGQGAPGALGSIRKHIGFRWVGWLSLVTVFFILNYYVIITSWAGNYLVHAWQLPWAHNTSEYFLSHFLHQSAHISINDGIVWPVVIGSFIIYSVLFFSLFKGTNGLIKIAQWLTPLPFILLLVLLINTLRLPGASAGLHHFFWPKWSMLLKPTVWFAAASQVFFSLSLGFGVMYTYGALLNKKYSVRYTTYAVIIGDTLVALLGGMIVFGTLGYMSLHQHVPIKDIASSGIGLAFITLPKALTLLPFGAKIFSVIFFLSLVALAFTSIVSIAEAILSGFGAQVWEKQRAKMLFILCAVSFLIGLLYAQSNGLYILDIVDHFISGYMLIFIGLAESILVAYYYNAKAFRFDLNTTTGARVSSLFDISVRYIVPIVLLLLLIMECHHDLLIAYGGFPKYYLWLFGAGPVASIALLAWALSLYYPKLDTKSSLS